MAKSLTDKLSQNAQDQQAKKETGVSITPSQKMNNLLTRMDKEIEKAVGRLIDKDRFIRIAVSTYGSNPAFWNCTDVSFLSALMMSAQLGLEPNTTLGHSYLIPYGNKVQFQIGYQGIIDLCHRTKMYKKITARCVYKEDKFEFEYGLADKLVHKPADTITGDPIYYYAKYELTNGADDFVVWSRDRVIAHAKKYSKSFSRKDSSWQESFNRMALKTCIIDVLKYAPKSIEVAKAVMMDSTVREGISENMEDIEAINLESLTEVAEVVDVEYQEEAKEGAEIKEAIQTTI